MQQNLRNKSDCGSHLDTLTFCGRPGSSALSHFHKISKGSLAKTSVNTLSLSGENQDGLTFVPKLTYITPSLEESR